MDKNRHILPDPMCIIHIPARQIDNIFNCPEAVRCNTSQISQERLRRWEIRLLPLVTWFYFWPLQYTI